MMPEGRPLWAGNIGLHVSHTIGGLSGAGPSHIRRPRYPKRGARPSNRNMRRDFCDLAYIYMYRPYIGVPNGRLSLDAAVLAFHDGGAGLEHLVAKLNRSGLGIDAHDGLGAARTQQQP